MLDVTHALTGAILGEAINIPAVSFGVGVVSHLILDKIPHFWPQKYLYREEMMIPDCIFAILFVAMLYYLGFSSSVIWGAIGGISVDFVIIGIPFIHKSKIGTWHRDRQNHKRSIKFLYYELLADLGLFLYLLRIK